MLDFQVQRRVRLERVGKRRKRRGRLQHHIRLVIGVAAEGRQDRVAIGEDDTDRAREIEVPDNEPVAAAHVPVCPDAEVRVLPHAFVARDQLTQSGVEHAPCGQVQLRLVIGETGGHPDHGKAGLSAVDLAARLHEDRRLKDHDRFALPNCVVCPAGRESATRRPARCCSVPATAHRRSSKWRGWGSHCPSPPGALQRPWPAWTPVRRPHRPRR